MNDFLGPWPAKLERDGRRRALHYEERSRVTNLTRKTGKEIRGSNGREKRKNFGKIQAKQY